MFKNEKMETQWEEFQDKDLSELSLDSKIIRLYTKEGKLNICTKEKSHILSIGNYNDKEKPFLNELNDINKDIDKFII